ncbi:unnamed protein product [Soboliphyme baturini]|uniref:Protein cueball n=1 Tax=Soboliphyme baturini TaxID=241478 RepID=A0A183J5H8_9BILA|nr:unnamed protein product [Soboliphyme baturini]
MALWLGFSCVISRTLYFVDSGKQPQTIEMAFLDGSHLTVLKIDRALRNIPACLSIDYETDRLFWVDRMTAMVHYIHLSSFEVATVSLPLGVKPYAISVGLNQTLYFLHGKSTENSYVGSFPLHDPSNVSILRRRTNRVVNLKVFNTKFQNERLTDNQCSRQKGYCQHLCLLGSAGERKCECTSGFTLSADGRSCSGLSRFIMYADSNHIGGIDENGSIALAPLPQVHSPYSLDFLASSGKIYWTDTEINQIISIRRDLTERTVIIEDPYARLESLAIDWIAGNIYWTNRLPGSESGQGVIEVARVSGSHRYIVAYEANDIPRSVISDPVSGYIFWLNSIGIHRSWLDGSDRVTVVKGKNITDISVDVFYRRLCWLDHSISHIACSNYDGDDLKIEYAFSPDLSYVTTFAINNGRLYWSDRKMQNGSIMIASIIHDSAVPVRSIQVTKHRIESYVTDLRIYDVNAQTGSNPCAIDNGGCEQLCLFRGPANVHVCRCSFGQLKEDNRTCAPYRNFLAYSRVHSIDFSYLDVANEPNSPFPMIGNRHYVRNVVGLAFDYEAQRLFYSDIHFGSIFVVSMNETQNNRPVITELVSSEGSVEGLTFDHEHKDLYWTSYTNGSINRVHVEGRLTDGLRPFKVLQLDSSSDKPRGIAVDPCQMRIYWTNWNDNRPSIERSYLSGADRHAIISTDIKTPNALVIDFKTRKLFWSDARLDKIERCEYDGTNRVVILKGKPNHPFGLAVHEDYLYWTDWILRAVVRINKYTGGDFTLIRQNFSRQPMAIIAVSNSSYQCKFTLSNIV